MTIARLSGTLVAASLAGLLVCGCGRHDGNAARNTNATEADGDVALPKPEATRGSVTGMPSKPGPNPVGPALAAASQDADTATVDDEVAMPAGGEQTDVGDTAAGAPTAADEDSDTGPQAGEPSAQDAVAVVRDYYAAINRQDYPRAWASWSDGGRSSGQTLPQFADGFAATTQVALQAGAPGPIGAAAGSRYVEVPVTIDATQRDGSVRRYSGNYTLRRAVVDGATDAQRAWHIASASLHPVGP